MLHHHLTTTYKSQPDVPITEKEGFAWPINLQSLGLTANSFSNDFFSSPSGLGHLKTLDLSLNQLEGSLNISGKYIYYGFFFCKALNFICISIVNNLIKECIKRRKDSHGQPICNCLESVKIISYNFFFNL